MEFETIKNLIKQIKEVDESKITLDTNFIEDLHFDSIEIFQIIMGIEEAFNIQIDNDELADIKTIKDAIEKIKNAKK